MREQDHQHAHMIMLTTKSLARTAERAAMRRDGAELAVAGVKVWSPIIAAARPGWSRISRAAQAGASGR